MSNIKGTDVVSLRGLFEQKWKDQEEKFVSQLSPEAAKVYKQALSTTWTPVNVQAEVYDKAARTVFHTSSEPVVALFREIAQLTYSTVYSAFTSVPTVKHIVGLAAQIWRRYYDAGDASFDNETANSIDLVVKDIPDLPKAMQDATKGHLMILIGGTGAMDPRVRIDPSDPNRWVWHVTWN